MLAYLIHLAILIGIYFVLALSLQVALGFTGLLNLGHIAFYCIGAYTSALLVLHGFPFWVSFILAPIHALLWGYFLSLPTRRLKQDYLALATLAFSFIIYSVALNWVSLTRGPLGLPGISRPSIFGFKLSNNLSYLIFTLFFTLLTFFSIYRVTSSPFGRVLEAIRDNELAVKILGKNTARMKSYALMISAFFAGLAGSLYAYYITFIDPSSFTLSQLIPILCIVIIGGLATLKGTFLATLLIVLLPEPLRFIGLPSSIVGPLRQIIYGTLLLLILIYKPKGFCGRIEKIE